MQNITPIAVPDGYPPATSMYIASDPVRAVDAILNAVRTGNLAQVTGLVADASYSPDDYLEKALIAAVKADKLEIGRCLLDHGANMKKRVPRIMTGSYAAMNKSLPFLKLFVKYGWDVNSIELSCTALHYFIRDCEAVTWLLAQKADPNLGTVETGIVRDGHLLDMVALYGSLEIFDKLMAHGARLEDSLALHHAAAAAANRSLGYNDTRIMARLLELGVDINEPDNKGKPKNGSLGAPIFWAIRENRISNTKFLVGKGVNVTVKAPCGGKPIELARKWGRTEIAEYLESLSVLPQPGEFKADAQRQGAMAQALRDSQVELDPWDVSRQTAYEVQLSLLGQQNKAKMHSARKEQHYMREVVESKDEIS